MEEFKKELTLKREARQRAIAAVSFEMERLRQELDAEKKAHSKTSSMLALLRSTGDNSQNLDFANDDFVKAKERGERKHDEENEKATRRAEALRLTNTLKVRCALFVRLGNEIRETRYKHVCISDFRRVEK